MSQIPKSVKLYTEEEEQEDEQEDEQEEEQEEEQEDECGGLRNALTGNAVD